MYKNALEFRSYVVLKLRPYFENISKRLVKSPKLYFIDPGLACYLLGIEDKAQLKRDPMRGHLFENMVVLELIKMRYNLGSEHNMYFYRDNHGNEVDVLFKQAHELIPMEIKSAKTLHLEFFAGLKFINKLLADRITRGYVIYAGDKTHKTDKFRAVNFADIADIFLTSDSRENNKL